MKEYELLYIVPHTYSEEELPQIETKVEELILKYKGENIIKEPIGKRRFAYPIKNLYHGYYFLTYFNIPGQEVQKLYNAIKLTDEVLRHIIVEKLDYTPKHPSGEVEKEISKNSAIQADIKLGGTKPTKSIKKKDDIVADIVQKDNAKKEKVTQPEPNKNEKTENKENEKEKKQVSKPAKKKITMDDLDKTLEELTKIDESLL